jgi:dTDP-glucose 4,6-dehydratase
MPESVLDRVLVTGGAGFVGSALVRRLLERHAQARVVTYDLLTYAGHLANLEGLPDERHAFVRGDVADPAAVAEAFRAHRPTAVVNVAAETHVDRSLEDAQRFVRTNVLGTQVVLDAAHAARVPMVHVSTDEVYGSIAEPSRAGPDAPLAPTSPYAASKAAGDLLARAAVRGRRQDVRVTRCTNNYGPRQMPEKLVPLMVLRARRGERLPVYGDGLQVRDWIHVDDHADGLIAALVAGRAGAVYHFAGGAPRRNLDVVREICRAVGAAESLVAHVEDRPDHDRRYALDDAATRSELRWSPRVRFEEGLAATVRWYGENEAWCRAVASADHDAFLERNYAERLRRARP